jgi:methylmalonyl-CoA mutase cobalamin-binding subunit
MAIRRPRRSVVVLATDDRAGSARALALAKEISGLGVEAVYLGHVEDPAEIVAEVLACDADAIEVCLSGGHGVLLVRGLLSEIAASARRDVSIVVHRLWG